ncbi:ATP-binding protein [Streptomyces zagrosensis]|uniref:DNA-binding CsgD family transcriptional regulator/tetratricopeptide (TPR) repeat protein n=1 Tax=Streptomyces zagrosensis TaxID=1042984 RepID=A0A7W9UZ62_9ACTN|nr:LuxR family transcriptional regulator [Streptomyces zagrosensis]MBB5935444.1 DNA-binding CsgD family transcriptional regulator/tetratricopeptide (TPR) repeat protein [Streptomyces zagrosensis]
MLRTSSPVLIGREWELRTLHTAVAAAPSVIFVEGEAGVGKSRLIAELINAMGDGPPLVAVQHCQPLRDPFPYGVVLECLSQCAGQVGQVRGKLSAVVGALRPYLPELADSLPSALPALGDPAAERHQLFRAVRDLLAALGRVVLVIEDMHWADEGTRQLLRFVMTDPPPGLSLVMTYRREDLVGNAPLGRPFRPPPSAAGAHLTLAPLDANGVRELVEAILGNPVAPGFAEIMWQRTAGIPFVVEEATCALRAMEGRLGTDEVTARRLLDIVEVPVLLREAMVERMHALPDDARAVAQASAVLGVPASDALLSAVAGVKWSRAHVTRLLEQAVLVEVAENEYSFRHALAQRAVYGSLSGPYRQGLHVRAVRELAQLDPPPLVRLALHCRSAGLTADWLRYSEAAAAAAMRAGDAFTAMELLVAAVAEPTARAADLDRLAINLCESALINLHHQEAIAQIEQLSSDPRLSDEVRGEVHLWLGLLLIRKVGAMARGRAEIELAVEALHGRPERRLRGMAVLALPYISTAPFAADLVWMERVEESLEALEPGGLRTELLASVLGARVLVGDPGVWDRLSLLPSVSEPVEAGTLRALARAHCNLADGCAWAGYYGRAREYLHSGLDLAKRAGAPYVVGTAEGTRARLDWHVGDWDGLAERIEQLTQTYAHLLWVTSELNLVKGWLATARGDWGRAETAFKATRMDQPDSAVIPVAVAAIGGMATLLLNRGDTTAACGYADRGAALIRRKGLWAWAGELACPAVEAYVAAGRLDDAHTFVADLAAGLNEVDAPLAQASLLAARAQLAEAAGDMAGAARLCAEAIGCFTDLGTPYRLAQLTETVAARAIDITELTDLARTYEELGATSDAARCRHLIRSAGVSTPSPRGRRGYGNELSPREREVRRLVAHGRTNREIAQAMFLSPRTVEEHVAKVLRKLGVKSRQEVHL